MATFELMRRQLSNNLKLLSTQEFIARHKENIEINPQTFVKLNAKTFQLITYHLFHTIDSEECKQRFIGCFPVRDRKQEGEFRQTTNKWLQEISAKETSIQFPRVVAIYFQHFTPEVNVCHLYLDFSNYVLQKLIQRLSSGTTQKTIPLNESSFNTIGNHFEEYQRIRTSLKEETKELIEKMNYFVDNYHKTSESLKTLNQNKTKLFESIRKKYGLKSDSNVEEFISNRFNQLKSDVKSLKTRLDSMNELVDKNWINYSKAFEPKNNCLTNSVIDLNEYKCEEFGSIASMAQEVINRTKDYDIFLQMVLDKDLNEFSNISMKFVNELQVYKNQSKEMTTHLKSMYSRLKGLSDSRRAELLSTPEIIERRQWIAERIPDFTKIKFKFEPKERLINDKEVIVDLIDKNSTDSPIDPKDKSPVYEHRPSLDYSFQIMDMSTCHYIPPSASMEDSRLFSPIENKTKSDFDF